MGGMNESRVRGGNEIPRHGKGARSARAPIVGRALMERRAAAGGSGRYIRASQRDRDALSDWPFFVILRSNLHSNGFYSLFSTSAILSRRLRMSSSQHENMG